jgi:hypothetical protein
METPIMWLYLRHIWTLHAYRDLNAFIEWNAAGFRNKHRNTAQQEDDNFEGHLKGLTDDVNVGAEINRA